MKHKKVVNLSEKEISIPIEDICPYQHIQKPWINYALIVSLFIMFVIQILFLKDNAVMYMFNWNLILGGEYWRLITHIFLHASILHLVGNIYFLYIFGDQCEDWFSRNKYLRFAYIPIFLFWGVIAGISFGITSPETFMLGASGAIAGCLGFYFIMYPHAQIKLLSFKPLPIKTVEDIEEIRKSFNIKTISAYHYLLGFFVLQVLFWYYGGAEGIAVVAHIFGFIIGVIMAIVCRYATHEPPTMDFYRELWNDIKELLKEIKK